MNKLFLDFETYYDDEYSLRKMSPIEYALDPRFEALGCAFSLDGDVKWWIDGPQLPETFAKVDWANTFAISHNALFDMLVLSLRYGVVPGMYGDTMAMARNMIVHHTGRVSLAACCKFFALPDKMDTVLRTKGVNFQALVANPALHREVKEYGIDDVGKCREIYNLIMGKGSFSAPSAFPAMTQLEIIDMVIRMATQPQLELDMNVLAEHLADVKAKKQELLDKAFLDDRSSLMSDQQLAAKFLFLGVEPPMKVSKATGKQQYAFAKTDKEFQALLEHEEPMVQALVAARLGHKSTIEETRTERLMAIGRVSKMLPVPLKYSGAHTHRLSGDWLINLQNLQRGGRLRKALKAPKGKVVVSVDASQIEARFNATLAKQHDLMEQFRRGEDVYSSFASDIYKYPVNKGEHPTERFVGKTGILSLGYGSSAPVFQNMCRVQGNVTLTDHEAHSIVKIYRSRFPEIVRNWNYANTHVIPYMGRNALSVSGLTWGPVRVEDSRIRLPSGNCLNYRDLRHEFVGGSYQWVYMRGQTPHRIYGAKIVENVVQALAFVHIMEVAMRVKRLTDGLLMPAHQIHDELLYVVDEALAEQVVKLVVAEMSRSPMWMPEAPLAAEGHIGVTYGDTK